MLWHNGHNSQTSGADSSVETAAVIAPAIPFLTIRSTELAFFWFAVFCAVAFHELGHAIAAAQQRIPIISVGVFISAVVPGAYVRLESTLTLLSPLQQLSVYCAGVWHNVVCSRHAYALFWRLTD